MNVFQATVFSGQTIRLDLAAYRNCTFNQCIIEYGGEGPISIVGCSFNHCDWRLVGAAIHTVMFLKTMYSNMGDFGKNMVEQTFKSIKENPGS